MSKKSEFEPIEIPESFSSSGGSDGHFSVTVTTTIKGSAGEQFEKMVQDNNLSRSLLLRQMVFHCLGRQDLINEIKRNIILWGEGSARRK